MFDGTNAQTRNLAVTDPNGQDYVVCTTIQYAYKSSQNTATLTVEPPKTDVTAPAGNEPPTQTPDGTTVTLPPPKTPEQVQQEAEQNGWMKPPEPRFTWGYPWFRLHFVGVYEGQDIIDIGVSPIPFADYFHIPDISVWRKVNEWFGKIAFNVISGMVAVETALWLLSHAGPIAFGIALFTYIGYKSYGLFVQNWNSVEGLWISLLSTIVSIEISIWTGVSTFISFIFHALIAGAAAVKSLPYGFLCKLIMIPVNISLLVMTVIRLASLGAL